MHERWQRFMDYLVGRHEPNPDRLREQEARVKSLSKTLDVYRRSDGRLHQDLHKLGDNSSGH